MASEAVAAQLLPTNKRVVSIMSKKRLGRLCGDVAFCSNATARVARAAVSNRDTRRTPILVAAAEEFN